MTAPAVILFMLQTSAAFPEFCLPYVKELELIITCLTWHSGCEDIISRHNGVKGLIIAELKSQEMIYSHFDPLFIYRSRPITESGLINLPVS